MKKKLVSALLCASMVATMVVGCGSSESETTAPTTEAATTEAATTEAATTEAATTEAATTEAATTEAATTEAATTEAAAASAGDVVTEYAKADGDLVYWSMWDSGSPQAVAIEEAVKAYEEKSGNKVNIEWKGRDITTLITASLDAGESIDVFEDDFQRLSQTFTKYCLPLDDMATAVGYESRSNAALVNGVKGWSGGSLVCIPYQPYTSGVFYNKKIFDEVGVTEPTTWEEFMDVCQKIKDAGYNPLTLDDAYASLNFGYHLARYIGQDKVKEISKSGDWASEPAVLKTAEDMVALLDKGFMSEYAPATFPAGENEVGYEETAMVVNASWVPAEITNATQCDLEWGMFSYPAVPDGVDGQEAAMLGGQGMAVSKDSKNAQAAFELIMTITTGEYDAKIATASDSIPADPTNAEWPELLKNVKPSFDKLTKTYEWDCGVDENQDTKEIVKEWCNKLFAKEVTAQEFVDGLTAACKK